MNGLLIGMNYPHPFAKCEQNKQQYLFGPSVNEWFKKIIL
jgi:hypothetical protein